MEVPDYAPWLPIAICTLRLGRSCCGMWRGPPDWATVRCGRSLRAFPRHRQTSAILRERNITIAEIKAWQESGGTLQQLAAAEGVSAWAVKLFIQEEEDMLTE